MTITSHIDIFAEILNSSFFTMKQSEIKKKYPYVERDISWMYFNQRILLEAARPEVPLLERLTFLGIYSNNLDEFFRVRVATLNRIVEYADKNIQAEQENRRLHSETNRKAAQIVTTSSLRRYSLPLWRN